MMRARFPLLLLGLVFLASVSVSFGIAYWEKQSPNHNKCLQSCKIEKDSYRFQACHARCNLLRAEKEEEEEKEKESEVPHHPRPRYPAEKEHHQESEKKDEDEEQPLPRPFPFPRPHRPHQEKEDEEEQDEHKQPQPHRPHEREEEHEERPRGKESGEQEKEDEEKTEREHPRPHPRPHRPHQREEHEGKEEQEQHQKGKESREQKEEEDEDEDEEEEEHSHKNKNPFHINSKRFQTLFRNQYGHIRILPSFNKRFPQLENLRDYRILELYSKPNTLLLPHHSDADYLIFILNGRAIITLVNGEESESYNLQPGDALRVPAGTTYYVINPDDNEHLRIITLAKPVNNPSRFKNFFLSSTQVQQSYLEGFSKNILEASYDTKYEEINKVLFGRQERQQKQQEQRLEEGVIVEIPKEQIRELSKRAISSSRKTISSEDKPFNLRSSHPIYSNNLGRFFEITPEKNPQLKDLDVSLSTVDIKKGALLLPHINSKTTVVLVINEGDANIELVGLKQQQQQQPLEVRKYRAELSEQDIFVIPAGYPVAVTATSNLNLFAFGINAEDNQRSFLAGEKDNLISQIQKPVLELSFPGSAQDIEKLIQNQKESYFVEAQPQEKQEDNRGRNVPLFSILKAFY